MKNALGLSLLAVVLLGIPSAYSLATWQNATSVIQPRFVKFQVRWDF